MAILVGKNTRVIVQGITGREGSFHTKLMLEYGTKIVAGVTPGKGGMTIHGVPVYNTIREALREHNADASIIFVPAKYASDAVFEAIDAELNPIVVITEHIPVHETLKFIRYAKLKSIYIIGPNTPGVITPGQCKLGIMPASMFKEGEIGLVSRSGTLTYEIARVLANHGYGITTAVGIGGDPVTGLNFIEVLEMFKEDPQTKAVIIVGEIGGDMEERTAEYIAKTNYPKPVVAYIAGKTAPPEKRMGHAGAIIMLGMGDYESKVKALRKNGVAVASIPSEIPKLLSKHL